MAAIADPALAPTRKKIQPVDIEFSFLNLNKIHKLPSVLPLYYV